MTRRALICGRIVCVVLAAGSASVAAMQVEPSSEEKLARLLKLEDERSLGEGEVVARLRDVAGLVRGRAALVLGRIGEPGAAAHIAPLLADPAPYARASAAFALGLLDGELPDDVRRRLTAAMDDENERVRARVLETLGRKGGADAAESIARALARIVPRGAEPYEWSEDIGSSALTYPHHDLRVGIFALTSLKSLRFAWDVLATEGQTPRFEWWPAAWAISELEGDQRLPLLSYYAGSRDPEFRFWGARGFRTLQNADSGQVRVMLSDPNERVRIAAVRAVAALRLSEAVPDLIALLERDSVYVQAEALKALAVLPAPAATELLLDRLGDESRWFRALTLPALARQDPEGFWLVLAGLGADRDWEVRAALAELLGRMTGSERPKELLRAMVTESKEPDARVRARALAALARRDREGVAPTLIERLSAEDPFERLAAARGLVSVGAHDGALPVKQAFLVESADEPWVKPALLDVLASLDPDLAVETARAALDDTNYLVRRQAASILRRRGEGDVAVRPRPSDMGLDEYRPYVSPPYSPQAFIRTSRGTIELELFVLDAPLTVLNFLRLARADFYDGLSFHRVLPNDHVQAGDPRGDGNGGPGYAIRSEINERPIVRGTVAMADHGRDTAGSQFFITHLPRPDLDGRYTVFGRVSSGMEIVDRIEPGDTIVDITIWDGVTSPHRER